MLRFVGETKAPLPDCMKPQGLSIDDDYAPSSNNPVQQKVFELVRRLAPEYGVSPRLALAVIRAESNFEPGAISPKNAQGLMQLIPETSVRFNVRKPFDPEQNIRAEWPIFAGFWPILKGMSHWWLRLTTLEKGRSTAIEEFLRMQKRKATSKESCVCSSGRNILLILR